MFPNSQIHVSASEFAYATSSNVTDALGGTPLSQSYRPADYEGVDAARWNLTFGNASNRAVRLCRGVSIVSLAGVTPGKHLLVCFYAHEQLYFPNV